jgi:hypothetical protein
MKETAAAFGLIWAGLVDASGMLLINDAGVVALGRGSSWCAVA